MEIFLYGTFVNAKIKLFIKEGKANGAYIILLFPKKLWEMKGSKGMYLNLSCASSNSGRSHSTEFISSSLSEHVSSRLLILKEG